MVRERRGRLSFLVRRRDTERAAWADLKARWSGARGTSRLMALFGAAERMEKSSSKMLCCRSVRNRRVDGGHCSSRVGWSSADVLLGELCCWVSDTSATRRCEICDDESGDTYAHTCDPCSGTTVSCRLSLSMRIHATLPNRLSEAVSSYICELFIL